MKAVIRVDNQRDDWVKLKGNEMSLAALTIDSIQRILGKPTEEMYLIVAKNSVLGLESEQIAQILGVTRQEIDDLQLNQDYRDVRLLVGAEYAKTLSEKDMSWDGIEAQALENLAKRVPNERDTDTLLRIAAVANKAQRRQSRTEQVLDPAMASTRVPLTLTRRFTERINNSTGSIERTETQQISLMNGSAVNPTFGDIDSLLGVSARPRIPGKIAFKTHDPDVSIADLDEAFAKGKGI